jgi:Zn-dependent membrane protease YugP
MFFYYPIFDWTLFLLLPALVFALIAQYRVNRAFEWGSGIRTSRGITGAQAARKILDDNGLYDVSIERVGGHLTDHYDPKENVIRLSDEVYSGANAAAIGVAAHEAGHAVQYAQDYFPIRVRAAIIPLTRIGA